MTRLKNVFAVSFIAMFAVAGAHATIMTQDNIVGGTNITIDKPTDGTNAGKVVVNGPDISGKVNSSQGSSAANKAVITNGSGVITTGTITSGMITDGTITTSDISSTAGITKAQLASAVQTSLGKADTALQSHQDISGKQNVSNMVTATTGNDLTSNKDSTTKYPSMATASALAESVQNNLGSQIAGKQDLLLINDNVTVTGSGNVITAVDAPGDGSVTFTKGTTLGSLATKSTVTSSDITDGTITTSDISSSAGITKGQLASAVQTSLGKADTALQSHQDISGKLNIAQGSSAANKAVITNSSGSITTGTIATGMITDGAVTSAKIADGTITTSDISSTAGITKTQLASAVQTSLGKADTALQSHQDISGKQNVSNMVTATTGTDFTSNKDSTTKYPSMATASALAESVQNNLGSQIAGKQDLLLINDNVTVTGSGNVITAVNAPGDGSVTFTKGTTLGSLATKSTVTSSDITNGTIVNEDIADGTIAKGKLTTAVQTSLGKADTALQSHQDISGKLNIAQGSSAASKAVVTNSSGSITTGTIATGMIADGAVTSAKIADGTITTSDISSTAGITKTQLASAVQTSLGKADTALQSHQDISGKQNVSNMVKATTGSDYTSNKTSTTMYPSMATANQLATDVQNNLGGQIAGKQDILLSGATGANVLFDGAGNMIVNVDAPGDGTVTFTKGRVQIPSGSETASSYASIWVE